MNFKAQLPFCNLSSSCVCISILSHVCALDVVARWFLAEGASPGSAPSDKAPPSFESLSQGICKIEYKAQLSMDHCLIKMRVY